jgi:catechol 2,3-dioxygenase-like lactoylglutathione lyase family enzyme
MIEGIAKKTCDVPAMLNRFHSAVIEVRDFEAALDHYGLLLGRSPSLTGQDPDRGVPRAMFRLANMSLEIRGLRDTSVSDEEEGLRAIRLEAEEACETDALGRWLVRQGVVCGEVGDESIGDRENYGWTRTCVGLESTRGIGLDLVTAPTGAPLDEAPFSAAEEASIRDLDHVVVFSADVESTRDFYASSLELRLALDKTFEERGVRLLFFRIGAVTIEIGSRLGARPKPEAIDRFGGLAWEVVDVDSIRERLLDEKFDVSEVRMGNKPGTRVCTVRNPVYGVPTLLIQPVSR